MPPANSVVMQSTPFAEQPPCRIWLNKNFRAHQFDTAALLLNSLKLVSHSEFERTLIRIITDTAAQVPGKVALYCVRDIPSGQRYFPNESNIPPPALSPKEEIGSEGRIANILRNISRENPNKFLNHPSIDEMRRVKCHRMFLVDDVIGTGETVLGFAKSIYRDPRIRGWISGRLMRISLFSYAASVNAEKCLRQSLNFISEIKFDCRTTGASIFWSHEQRSAIERLCKESGRRTNNPDAGLGYENSLSFIVFEHGCPDNAPAILWSNSGRWSALFKNRSIPSEVTKYFDPQYSSLRAREIFKLLGHNRLAEAAWLGHADPDAIRLTIILAAISKKLRKTARISDATGISIVECDRLIAVAVEYGLLTSGPYLTPLGLAELQRLKRIEAQRKVADGNEPFYYPHSLRGSGKL